MEIELIGAISEGLLVEVRGVLAKHAVEAYLIGGYVRDTLLGRDRGDIDIVVATGAMEIAQDVARSIGGKYVPLDEANEIARVVLPHGKTERQRYLDFSSMRGSIEEDLAHRDFTINAIAVSLGESAHLIDPLGGRRDLKERLVRAASDEAFEEDPARLLRAVRLAAEFGFVIEPRTEALIQRYSKLIAKVASERITEELCRILAAPKAAQSLRYLDQLRLLEAIIPELTILKGAEQPKEHFWDVFEHSMETVAAIELLLRERGAASGSENIIALAPWSAALSLHFDQEVSNGHTRRVLLKLAALLHDIAKPQTKTIDDSGRTRFFGHPKEGARIAGEILERLRFSSREVKMIQKMIEHHLRPAQMGEGALPSHRAIYRYFRDTDDVGIDTIFLSLADHLATRGPMLDLAQWQEHARMADYVLAERFKEESVVTPPKLIDGHDLIDIFGMSPGPQIGVLLEEVRQGQAAGEITTREEALSFVAKRVNQ